MSFFQLFQYCLGSGLGTTGDFSSEQLLRDPFAMLKQYYNHSKQYRTNVATLCCAKNCCCESSRVTSPLHYHNITCTHYFLICRRVVSHYVQDDTSFVPVQDVVKAFKEEYNVDLSYKECHQMILSAFTTPRNRLIAKKTVRVSTFGQQYVYRGIAPINKAICPSDETKVW